MHLPPTVNFLLFLEPSRENSMCQFLGWDLVMTHLSQSKQHKNMIWGALTCQELVCLVDWQHICKWERLTSLLTVKAHTPSHLTPRVMNWHHGTIIRTFFYCKCMSSQLLQSALDRTSVCCSLEPIVTTNALRMTSPWASASPEPNIHDRDMTPSVPQPL